jgi:hypothetical protein
MYVSYRFKEDVSWLIYGLKKTHKNVCLLKYSLDFSPHFRISSQKTTKYCIFLLSEGKISLYYLFKEAGGRQEEGRGPP